jgi:hypothetical protein
MLQISDEIRKAMLLNIAITGVEALTAGAGGKGASAIGGAVVRGGRTALSPTAWDPSMAVDAQQEPRCERVQKPSDKPSDNGARQ